MLIDAGLDPAEHPAQPLSAGALRRADRVISLSTTLDVARIPGPRYETWETGHFGLADQGGVDERDRRDALARRVQALATDLTTVPDPVPTRADRLRGLISRLTGR